MAGTPAHDPIFISYSRKDTAFMHRLRDDLGEAGLATWVDETGLTPGTPDWEKAIEDALHNASCLTVILSPDAKQSTWVGLELAVAQRLRKDIFPVLARGDPNTAVPMRLELHQRVDARENYASAVESLVHALSEHLSVTLQPADELDASLSLKVWVNPATVPPGGTADWTVSVRNDGRTDLNPVNVGREGGRRLIEDPFPLPVGEERRLSFSTTLGDEPHTESLAATGFGADGQKVVREVSQTVGIQQIQPASDPTPAPTLERGEPLTAVAHALARLPSDVASGLASDDPAARFYAVAEADVLLRDPKYADALRAVLENLVVNDTDLHVRRRALEILNPPKPPPPREPVGTRKPREEPPRSTANIPVEEKKAQPRQQPSVTAPTGTRQAKKVATAKPTSRTATRPKRRISPGVVQFFAFALWMGLMVLGAVIGARLDPLYNGWAYDSGYAERGIFIAGLVGGVLFMIVVAITESRRKRTR